MWALCEYIAFCHLSFIHQKWTKRQENTRGKGVM